MTTRRGDSGRSGVEEIGNRALELMLREPALERPTLIRWAAGELRRFDLGDPAFQDVHQFVAEAFTENPRLGDWMRARGVSIAEVLAADSFRDLVDRITPAYGDG